MSDLITLTNVSKVYDGARRATPQSAISDVSLQVPAGQFVAIMGPSGSGKSTLLNLIAGLDKLTHGDIQVDSVPVGRLGEAALARYRRTRLGFVFQFFNLLNQLTVFENVLLPAQLAGLKPRIAQERARQLLDQLDISDQGESYPARLSGGQRQRVAIARALINRPAVLLADEPTGSLDSRSGEVVMEMLARVNRDGQTILLVTHDARLASAYSGRVITLRDGRIIDDTHLSEPTSQAPADFLRLHTDTSATTAEEAI